MKLDKEILKPLVGKNNPTILDIGCYDGSDSLEFLNIFTEAKLYAFDADERSIGLFRDRFKNDNRVTLTTKAVCDTNDGISWYASDSETRRHFETQEFWSASSSIKKPKEHLNKFTDVNFKEPIKVESIKLDDWVESNNITNIDIIWCDVNGANREFISGAKNTIKNKTKFIIMEFEETELYEGSMTLEDILNELPEFEKLGVYNFEGNFGNVLLKNTTI